MKLKTAAASRQGKLNEELNALREDYEKLYGPTRWGAGAGPRIGRVYPVGCWLTPVTSPPPALAGIRILPLLHCAHLVL